MCLWGEWGYEIKINIHHVLGYPLREQLHSSSEWMIKVWTRNEKKIIYRMRVCTYRGSKGMISFFHDYHNCIIHAFFHTAHKLHTWCLFAIFFKNISFFYVYSMTCVLCCRRMRGLVLVFLYFAEPLSYMSIFFMLLEAKEYKKIKRKRSIYITLCLALRQEARENCSGNFFCEGMAICVCVCVEEKCACVCVCMFWKKELKMGTKCTGFFFFSSI